jgi:hypothetical protein
MKRMLSALALVATAGLAATVGPPGAAYASTRVGGPPGAASATYNVTVKWVCTNTPLFTDPALTVPAGIVPLHGQYFYLEGMTNTAVELAPITVPPAPTIIYYGKKDCFVFIIHI